MRKAIIIRRSFRKMWKQSFAVDTIFLCIALQIPTLMALSIRQLHMDNMDMFYDFKHMMFSCDIAV